MATPSEKRRTGVAMDMATNAWTIATARFWCGVMVVVVPMGGGREGRGIDDYCYLVVVVVNVAESARSSSSSLLLISFIQLALTLTLTHLEGKMFIPEPW